MPKHENPLVSTPAQGAQLLLADPDQKDCLLRGIQPKNIEDLIEVLLAYLELGQKGFDFVAELLKKYPEKFANNIITEVYGSYGLYFQFLGENFPQGLDFLISTNKLAQIFFTLLPFDPEGKLVCLLLTQPKMNDCLASGLQSLHTYSPGNMKYKMSRGYNYDMFIDPLQKIIAALCQVQDGVKLLNRWLETPNHWLNSDSYNLFSLRNLFCTKEITSVIKNIDSPLAKILRKAELIKIFYAENIQSKLNGFACIENLLKQSSRTSRAWKNFFIYYVKTINNSFKDDFFCSQIKSSHFYNSYIKHPTLDSDNIDSLAQLTLKLQHYNESVNEPEKYENSIFFALICGLLHSIHAYRLAESLFSREKANAITHFSANKNEYIVYTILSLYQAISHPPDETVQHLSEQVLSIIDRLLTAHPAFSKEPDDFFTVLQTAYELNNPSKNIENFENIKDYEDIPDSIEESCRLDIVYFLTAPRENIENQEFNLIMADKLGLSLHVFLDRLDNLKVELKKKYHNHFTMVEHSIKQELEMILNSNKNEVPSQTFISRRPQRLTTPQSLANALEYLLKYEHPENTRSLLEDKDVMQRCFFEPAKIVMRDFVVIVVTTLMLNQENANELIAQRSQGQKKIILPSVDQASSEPEAFFASLGGYHLFAIAKLDGFKELLNQNPDLSSLLKESVDQQLLMPKIENADQFLGLYHLAIKLGDLKLIQQVERMRYFCYEPAHQLEFTSLQTRLNPPPLPPAKAMGSGVTMHGSNNYKRSSSDDKDKDEQVPSKRRDVGT